MIILKFKFTCTRELREWRVQFVDPRIPTSVHDSDGPDPGGQSSTRPRSRIGCRAGTPRVLTGSVSSGGGGGGAAFSEHGVGSRTYNRSCHSVRVVLGDVRLL